MKNKIIEYKQIAEQILSSQQMSFCLIGATGTGKTTILRLIYDNAVKESRVKKFDDDLYFNFGSEKYIEQITHCIKSVLNEEQYYQYLLIELSPLTQDQIKNLRNDVLDELLKKCRILNCKIVISIYSEQSFDWYCEKIELSRNFFV